MILTRIITIIISRGVTVTFCAGWPGCRNQRIFAYNVLLISAAFSVAAEEEHYT